MPMSERDRSKIERIRIRLVLLAMLGAFVFLGVSLWRIQVLNTSQYRSSLDRQSMRRVRLPGIRGRIFDRNGVCLAANRPRYCLAIYTEELRQPGKWTHTIDKVEEVISELSVVLGELPQVSRKDITQHINRRLPLPFLAWHGLDEVALARLAEHKQSFRGVDIYVEPMRVYPHGTLATHVIGYVGRADPVKDSENPYHYYLPEMVGKEGMERAMDSVLRGKSGGCLIRVDASGFKYNETGERESVAGSDVHLTLDLKIQEVAERVLGGRPAAAVVLDVRNGNVLALASSPTYNVESIKSLKSWQKILEDPDRPLLNRAIRGRYPPGSTFKPLIAITGLQNKSITPDTILNCPGYYMIGNRKIKCWSRRGHGHLKLRKAIEQSCNPFFCNLGILSGYKNIYHMADSVGFGHRTGIELLGEKAGLLPDDEWKRRVMHEGWRAGDTCNVSIGQGYLLVTPLQMAVFASALANGGYIYRPRLVDNGSPGGDLINRMAWSQKTMGIVRGGMYDVVQAPHGTGKRVKLAGVAMGAKTGTAQYGHGKHYAWMILFAPFDSPRYAIAIVVEDAVSGGITVAPRMKELIHEILVMDGTLQPELKSVTGEGPAQG
jgi:penicillin-binding protein 2